ncbi:DnaB-like helicase N-terminal domain-containing protein [Streptomyces hiroshimensis]
MLHPHQSHQEIDLEEPAPPAAVHFAEQAVLGALLLSPHHLDAVTSLAPGDFGNHAHSALWNGCCWRVPSRT